MGVCFAKKTKAVIPQPISLIYRKTAQIRRLFSDHSGKYQFKKVKIKLTDPLQSSSSLLTIENQSYTLSQCVLPGLDPSHRIKKQCQDLCFSLNNSQTIFAGLYDGHGKEGQRIVQHCTDFAINYYQLFKQEIESPSSFLQALTTQCDKTIKSNPTMDIHLSGCTQVLLFFHKKKLVVANVGDSRGILATFQELESVKNEEEKLEYQEDIENYRKNRKIPVSRLKAVQITNDHRLNDSEESKRIIQSGGYIRKVTDTSGKSVGPFRV